MKRVLRLALVLAVLGPLAACESTKSANPLSPTVAGPIPGVNITPPKPLEPGNGWQLKADKQPLTLLLENASSNGVRPLTYVVEIATDAEFKTKVFSKSGIAQGEAGRTKLPLGNNLETGRTYYWHARAEDGANTGPFSNPVAFVLLQPASIDRPVPVSPVRGQTTDTTPGLRFRNAPRSGPVGGITYILEVSRNDSFTSVVWNGRSGEHGGETSVRTGDLPPSATLFWRVRASDGEIQGPWSATAHFVTSAPPPVGGGGGGGGGGNGGSCASRNGDFIVQCIAAKYPGHRRAGVSVSQRQANMRFLRDRIIEAGLCGGLDLGWNLKRGGPEISVDFLTERVNGRAVGHDIAADYTNTKIVLQLYWGGGTFPTYTKYTNGYTCN